MGNWHAYFEVLIGSATIWYCIMGEQPATQWVTMVLGGCLQISRHGRSSSWCIPTDVTWKAKFFPQQLTLQENKWGCTGWWLSLTISLSSILPSLMSFPTFYCSQYAKTIRKSFPHSKVSTLLRQPPACLCRGRTCNGSLLPGLPGMLTKLPPENFQVHLSPALSHNCGGIPSGLPSLPPSYLPSAGLLVRHTLSLHFYQLIILFCLLRLCSHLTSYRKLWSQSPACTELPPLNSGLDAAWTSLHAISFAQNPVTIYPLILLSWPEGVQGF